MKLLHIADLHIGKRVNEFSMIEDQRHILKQILSTAESEKVDAVLIAGDIYDKSHPPIEAVELLDQFLTDLIALAPVFMISGNHDSPERLGFARHIMKKNGLHIGGTYEKNLYQTSLTDEYGPVHIYMLPFIKPSSLKAFFEQSVETYQEAMRLALSETAVDLSERNILIAHQFFTAGSEEPERSDSEMISVGGLDNIDISVLEKFDYVALGHLHRPQQIGSPRIRYAGSPLKYSFSEALHQKSIVLLEFLEKGNWNYRLIPLIPLRDLRKIKGPIAELLRLGSENPLSSSDYIHATLTDEDEIYDAIGQMRSVYPHLMSLDFDNSRVRMREDFEDIYWSHPAHQDPIDLFDDFYNLQNNRSLDEQEKQMIRKIFEQSGEQMI